MVKDEKLEWIEKSGIENLKGRYENNTLIRKETRASGGPLEEQLNKEILITLIFSFRPETTTCID